MSDDIFNLQEHRRRRGEDGNWVRCAHCGKLILASANRCPACGVHFQGEAQDYLHPSEQPRRRLSWWVVALAVLVVVAVAFGALGRW